MVIMLRPPARNFTSIAPMCCANGLYNSSACGLLIVICVQGAAEEQLRLMFPLPVVNNKKVNNVSFCG